MTVQRIQCPNCGRSTIKGKFCIYCGYTLEESPRQEREEVEIASESPQQPAESEETPEQVEQAPAPVTKAETTAVVEQQAEEGVEERRLVEQLAGVYSWWIRLLELFLEKDVTPDVFQELYQEYRARINNLDEKRRDEINRIEKRLEELTSSLEKLKVRHDIGEIPDRQYVTQKLEMDREINRLKPKLGVLQNPFNLRLAEIPGFKEKIENLLQRFDGTNHEELQITEELLSSIKEDLKKILQDLEILVEQHNKIRKELDKLEVRYKIGELSKEEYLAQKQKIERQLESN